MYSLSGQIQTGRFVVLIGSASGAAPDRLSPSRCDEALAADVRRAPLLADIAANPATYYLDVHNADFTAGALRGQLAAIAAPVAAADADVELVSKVDAPDPATVGQPLTYTITVRNNGPDVATNVAVTDILPAGLTFVSASASSGCANNAGTVTCNLGILANGATTAATIVVTPTAAGTVVNKPGQGLLYT